MSNIAISASTPKELKVPSFERSDWIACAVLVACVAAVILLIVFQAPLGTALGVSSACPLPISLISGSVLISNWNARHATKESPPPELLQRIVSVRSSVLDTNFADFAKMRTGENIYDQDVILALTAKYDHNKALQEECPSNLDQLEKVAVICKEIGSVKEFEEAVEQVAVAQRNRIKALWIRAHGSLTGTRLIFGDIKNWKEGDSLVRVSSDTIEIAAGSVSVLKKPISLLEKNASIILDSCLAGATQEPLNIAKAIAAFAEGRTVFAPTCKIHAWSGRIKSLQPFEIHFYSGTASEDITAVFRDFPKQ